MIVDASPLVQSLLGSLFTWGLTFLGALGVVFIPAICALFTNTPAQLLLLQNKILDVSLGFASGVMLAASFWSLLDPAIELAEEDPLYGEHYSWVPPAIGFSAGGLFILWCDRVLKHFGYSGESVSELLLINDISSNDIENSNSMKKNHRRNLSSESNDVEVQLPSTPLSGGMINRRKLAALNSSTRESSSVADIKSDISNETIRTAKRRSDEWKRVLLLVAAVTAHNIPEGMAVGVAFGSVGQSVKSTFSSARNLTIGIGLQNFPEGLAVSMPLYKAGVSLWQSVFWGQLSGVVEPLGAILGACAVLYIRPLLPYALSFAAGAMIYVVVDDLVPETVQGGNQQLGSIGTMIGFLVMMIMDVAL